MIVMCPACQARFQYDDSRFGASPGKRFRCPKCSHVFEVVNPLLAPPEETLSRPLDLPEPEPPPPQATVRRDREAMLASAGLLAAGLPPGLRYSLAILTGPQASTVKVLDKPVTVIGREDGDVVTGDPETSRRHALLEVRQDGSVWLSDQQSTNGTLVAGEPILGPLRLDNHQEFTCGNSTFMLLVRDTDELPLT